MKKRILILLLAFTFTASFAASNKLPKPKPTQSKISLPAFSAINVTGFVNVQIRGTSSKNPKDTVIEARNPQWVSAKVRQHTLYLRALTAASPSRKAPTVKIRMYQLNRLDVYGRASVTAKNMKSNGLYLRADTTGNVTLDGTFTVNRINNYGPGKISIRWVKGPAVSVHSIAGHIKLAGNVTELRVKLQNHAILDAQYLRASQVLVQTKDFATAKVLPIQSLRAFANDHSNVYFYKRPEHISRYTSRSGNVLQLKDRP